MFEKFTERARRVMKLTFQEAQRLNSEFIGTEHILLGIIQEGGSVASKVLRNLQVDYKSVRRQIETLVTPPTSSNLVIGQLPFSLRSKRAIELASDVALDLGQEVIGTEHLLIGLLEESEGIAARVLANLGLDLEEVRRRLLEVIGAPHPAAAVVREASWSERTRTVVLNAVAEARAMQSTAVDPEHLLLAMLAENGPAAGLLTRSGITAEAIRGVVLRNPE